MFMKAQPWRWWSPSQPLEVSVAGNVDRHCEGCLMGFDDGDPGIILYETAGALERVLSAVKAGKTAESLQEDCISVMVNCEPEWAAQPMDEAYGFRGIPVPLKLQGGRIAEIDTISLILLCAALEAASKLRPDNLTGRIDWTLGKARLQLTIQAPAPLV
jgi:hypothetical protein